MFPLLRRSSYRHRLWMLAGGVAIFLSIVTGVTFVQRASAPTPVKPAADAFALDFIAFYTGGTFVAEGHHRDLFNLSAVHQFQSEQAARRGVELGDALGPWWNPPFYAWVFVPLASLSFEMATVVWVGFNILCTVCACWLLVRMLPRDCGWKTWALVPTLIALSVPFIHCLTHGQNTGMSLLIVTATVTAWRDDRALLAGLLAGLMFYKMQHAVVLGGMLTLSLGWRGAVGVATTGIALLLITVFTLPGSLGDFLRHLPLNVAFVQEQCVYMWERHTTLKAFWRLLLQGREIGPPSAMTTALTAVCAAAVAVALLPMTGVVRRFLNPFDREQAGTPDHRDRLIAATFLATPLLMPFYFDYDLLLLAVPAVLLAGLKIRTGAIIDGGQFDRILQILFPIAYAWMLLNADVAERTGVNVLVPLIAVMTTMVATGRDRHVRDVVHVDVKRPEPMTFNRAA